MQLLRSWLLAALMVCVLSLRARGFPVDVMVIDYDWPEVANNFEWAQRWKGDFDNFSIRRIP